VIWSTEKPGDCGYPKHRCPFTVCSGHEQSRDTNLTTSSASTDAVVMVDCSSSSPSIDSDLEELEELYKKAKKELDERALREKERRKELRRSRPKQRQGRGHDPRRQVVARTRSHGRGKGRR